MLCSCPEDLVEQVAAALPPTTRFAVFDAVTSNTAVVLPTRQLVELCHSRWARHVVVCGHWASCWLASCPCLAFKTEGAAS